jgi:hypothetical protein
MARFDNLLLKIVNVLVFFLFFGSNVYTSIGPEAGYGGAKETYITPAPFGFFVWTLINLLLLGFIVYQFTERGHVATVENIGWRFPALAILHSIYIHLFARGHFILAFIFSLLVFGLVSHIYYDLKFKNRIQGLTDGLFIHLPFSLWHAWSVVLIVISAFAAFGVSASTHKAGVGTIVFAAIAIVFLASTAVGYAFHSDQGDIAGAIVIAYELLAIFVEQRKPDVIHWFALAGFIISVLAILKALFFTVRKGRSSILAGDEERAPLVSGSD